MHNLNQSNSWKSLNNHYNEIKDISLNKLFKDDTNRFDNFSLNFNNMLIDYSKNHINKKTLSLFKNLLTEININKKIKNFFDGRKINFSENRAVMHYLLRGSYSKKNKKIYKNDVKKSLKKIKKISDKINLQKMLGNSGKKIKNVINIGIGGSDLGPKMVCEALKYYSNRKINLFFISNIDPTNLRETLRDINAEESIFIISSKSFETIETLTNATIAKKWFLDKSFDRNNLNKHFFSVTKNVKKAKKFGINKENIFPFWDWVGGRYSLWSPIGLPISIQIGFNNFNKMLEGAKDMDNHFRIKPFEENIPIIMACIGIWYNNFHNCETHAIFPYDEYLKLFPSYLQQADMESNGKSITKNNKKTNYETGPIIWGDKGTNGQHTFFQLIHQGTKIIPSDFIGFINSLNKIGKSHEMLLSNLIGQTKALMQGKSEDEVKKTINQEKNNGINIDSIIKSKSVEGNKPSTTILFDQLTPYNLGKLIALYEHKIFVQGCIWNINSYDQWGVELGKELSNEVYENLNSNKTKNNLDSSTNGLINFYKKLSHK